MRYEGIIKINLMIMITTQISAASVLSHTNNVQINAKQSSLLNTARFLTLDTKCVLSIKIEHKRTILQKQRKTESTCTETLVYV